MQSWQSHRCDQLVDDGQLAPNKHTSYIRHRAVAAHEECFMAERLLARVHYRFRSPPVRCWWRFPNGAQDHRQCAVGIPHMGYVYLLLHMLGGLTGQQTSLNREFQYSCDGNKPLGSASIRETFGKVGFPLPQRQCSVRS